MNQNLRQIAHTGGGLSPTWSPDGQWLAFLNGGIDVIRADGSQLHQIAPINRQLAAIIPRHLAWSPDGKWIAYQDSGATTLISPDGQQSQTIPGIQFSSWIS